MAVVTIQIRDQGKSRRTKRFFVCARFCVLIFLSCVGYCSSLRDLPPKYREWLQRDATYIITKTERDSFLQLHTDAERDSFIERFWSVRNPDPDAPINTFREEHYRRQEYAIQHFSTGDQKDGWDTDRGRIYITLGEPQQKARYVTQSEVRGMEIWFYAYSHPALPPHFNIIFYEKNFGDYRLYSPYMDGPQKLVAAHYAENGRLDALRKIDRDLGREVARTTLSLIPGEPVNMDDANSSLESDVMLGTIKGLANHPFTIDALNLRRSLSESVTHRVILNAGDTLNAFTVAIRDTDGETNLHYVLRLRNANDFAVAESSGKYYYSVEVFARVMTADGKLIFDQTRKLSKYLNEDEVKRIKSQPFGYEGVLPLAPGKYRLEFILTNQIKKTAYRLERQVVVADPASGSFQVTEPVPFNGAETTSTAGFAPFSAGGVKFTPYVGSDLSLVPGQDLKIFYQIWAPGFAQANQTGKKLLVDYGYGRPSFPGSTKTIHEEVDRKQFDRNGSLISGKKIPTLSLQAGNYRLSITVTDPETRQKAFSSVGFKIANENPSSFEAFDIIVDDPGSEYAIAAKPEYERALTYLAADNKSKAIEFLNRVFEVDRSNEQARARLVDLYFNQEAFAKVTELVSLRPITEHSEVQTIVSGAESYAKLGDTKKAAEFVESAISLKPPSGPLYLLLSKYYRRLGNDQKASELEAKAKSIMALGGTPAS